MDHRQQKREQHQTPRQGTHEEEVEENGHEEEETKVFGRRILHRAKQPPVVEFVALRPHLKRRRKNKHLW